MVTNRDGGGLHGAEPRSALHVDVTVLVTAEESDMPAAAGKVVYKLLVFGFKGCGGGVLASFGCGQTQRVPS